MQHGDFSIEFWFYKTVDRAPKIKTLGHVKVIKRTKAHVHGPVNPQYGQIWYDPHTQMTYIYFDDETGWVPVIDRIA